jgi:glucose/arabinose dehydrogenase
LLANVPAGFTESVVATDLTSPIAMTLEPSGERLWVAFQDGRLGVIENDAMLPQLAITLDADGSGERGFQGILLDSDFETNGYIYVYYTAASPEIHNRLSRLTVDPTTENTILPGSELILLELPFFSTLPQNPAPIWHMGGAIHFLPDETIAVQVGDHLNNSLVQNNNAPMGKILRVNKDGSPATDNPFYNPADTNPPGGSNWISNPPGDIDWIDYVWASGLRNPFSGDVDPATGRYFVNDVGEGTWEEINDATLPARSFGWPTTEGMFNPAAFPNFTNPVLAYNHSEDCAITGGAFYSPVLQQFPAQYDGAYFYSEFCSGEINYIDPDSPGTVHAFVTDALFPMNIEVAPDGSLYYIARGAGAGGAPGIGTGQVLKIQFAAQIAPQILQQPADMLTSVGYDAIFEASAAGTAPLAYQWQRHNGTSFVDVPGATASTLSVAGVTLADNGAQVRLVATNAYGTATSNVATLTVTTDAPPTPVIVTPMLDSTYVGGDVISFTGAATDLEDGALGPDSMTWQVDFHHNVHSHPFIPPTSGIDGGTFAIPTLGETAANVYYRITLTVTDSAGLSTQTFRDVQPMTGNFSVLTNFGGGEIFIDGQAKSAPTTTTGVVNIQRTLTAPVSQVTPGGELATFVRWLDGLTSPTRTIATPVGDKAYIALYANASQSLAFLSDLPVANDPPPNGWGPIERDTSNGGAAAGDGNPMAVQRVGYVKGLGVHAPSDVRYNLGGSFERFIADVGVDDETGANGSVVFRVFGDGIVIYESPVLTGNSASRHVNVSVAGVDELRLVVADGGDGVGSDHANWANARLIGSQTGAEVRINFQETNSTTPPGYLSDIGMVFGNRGNGQSYGWSSSHTDLDRDRNINADQRLDTLVHFHQGQTWEISVPNGAYAVTASIGDAGFNSTHTLNVEGVPYWTEEELDSNEFRQRTMLATVADGRLTLDMGSAPEQATRINYIEISPTSSPPLFPLTLADFDNSGVADGHDFLAWQRGLAAPGAGHADGDADGDGDVDRLDLAVWNETFGKVTDAAAAGQAASTSATVAALAAWGDNLDQAGVSPSTSQVGDLAPDWRANYRPQFPRPTAANAVAADIVDATAVTSATPACGYAHVGSETDDDILDLALEGLASEWRSGAADQT